MTRTWRGVWQRLLSAKQRSLKLSRPAFSRPLLERLEDRLVLSTFLVTNTGDNGGVNPAVGAGTGTLRQAIVDSNAAPGANVIDFNIGSGVQTISLLAALPAVTTSVTIDGTSQPGFAGSPLIVLDGSGAGAGVNGLTITAGNSTVEGLVVDHFSASGIVLETRGGDVLQGNYIGIDASGTVAAGNGDLGVFITTGSNNNVIGGTTAAARNLISGNALNAVVINGGATGNAVEGNYIGTDVTGTQAVGNGGPVFIGDAGTSNNTIGGTAAGAGNLISGNAINAVAIVSNASGNFVQGNLIGTDVTGTVALGNGSQGGGAVLLASGAHNNVIGGTTAAARNVISANVYEGIVMVDAGTTGNVVEGNYIGTDVTGTRALGNGVATDQFAYSGVFVGGGAHDNVIGGTSSGAGNLISGNVSHGLEISGSGTTGNLVQGNFIGTDASGTAALGNGQDGSDTAVSIDSGASNNTIGGTVAGARNLISGNVFNGLRIFIGSGTTGNVVQGNYIGTDVTGTVALGNGGYGVGISDSASGNLIGGTAPGAGNLISANASDGVRLFNSATGNTIQGNYIGTDASGTAALGNAANGVLLTSASNNTIGGTAAGAGNVIAFSGNDGVKVDIGTGNAIRDNSIHDSTNLGIELVNNGNNNQPAPVLASAVTTGSSITISGTLTAAANTSYALDFFASPTANPSGFGEGQQFLGSATVTTDTSGTVNFMVTFNVAVPAGQAISATATDPSNNTSAFAQDVTASAPATPAPLAARPVITDVGNALDNLFVLLSSGKQATSPVGEGVPSSPDLPARPAVPAWSLLAPRARGGDHSVSRSLDLFLAAALGGRLT